MGASRSRGYARLTPALMLQLAAVHTWPASLNPVLVAAALAQVHVGAEGPGVSPVMLAVLLAISVLLQSAVNTINDYYDYVKGADTRENQSDPADAVLVYNNVNPASVRGFSIALIVTAFALGAYCVYHAGWPPLLIAGIGVVVIFLYSGGATPISYLPLGELVSGFTMGGLILVACYYCLVGEFAPLLFVWALPVICGIALIMLTNNGCDREKDAAVGRRTVPVLLGQGNTLRVYHALVYAWIASICILVAVFFTTGLVVVPVMLLAVHPLGRALLANPLTPASRQAAFAQVTSLNIALGAFYACAIYASAFPLAL